MYTLSLNTEKTAKNEKEIFLKRNSISADSQVQFGFITNSKELCALYGFLIGIVWEGNY